MKVFAMLMLRCTLIMLLFSFLQNETLATLDEWKKWEKWKTSSDSLVEAISKAQVPISLDELSGILQIDKPLNDMLDKVKKFPIEGMGKLLKRRLKLPLKMSKLNCNKLLDEAKHSGLEDNKKYLESFVSKTSSITKGIRTEFNTFIFEVELELIKKVKWTSGNKKELENKFTNLSELVQQIESYCIPQPFNRATSWVSGKGRRPQYEPGTPEFVEYLGILIFDAKLGILQKELRAKIAVFAQQQLHIDGDRFMLFSNDFIDEWNEIKQNIDKITKKDDKDTFCKKLDDLAEIAMKKTAPLKAIITKKLDQLCPGSLKNLLKKVKKSFKSDQKEEAKKEIDALKQIISDIGMFDGAAYKLLVSFGQKLDNTAFSFAKLKEAVEQDKKMVLAAYQVKDKITSTMK